MEMKSCNNCIVRPACDYYYSLGLFYECEKCDKKFCSKCKCCFTLSGNQLSLFAEENEVVARKRFELLLKYAFDRDSRRIKVRKYIFNYIRYLLDSDIFYRDYLNELYSRSAFKRNIEIFFPAEVGYINEKLQGYFINNEEVKLRSVARAKEAAVCAFYKSINKTK